MTEHDDLIGCVHHSPCETYQGPRRSTPQKAEPPEATSPVSSPPASNSKAALKAATTTISLSLLFPCGQKSEQRPMGGSVPRASPSLKATSTQSSDDTSNFSMRELENEIVDISSLSETYAPKSSKVKLLFAKSKGIGLNSKR